LSGLHNISLSLAEMVTKLSRHQGTPAIYADMLLELIPQLFQKKDFLSRLSIVGFNPFYDLDLLGRTNVQLTRQGKNLGGTLEEKIWTQMARDLPANN
jgi:hypothetical protein